MLFNSVGTAYFIGILYFIEVVLNNASWVPKPALLFSFSGKSQGQPHSQMGYSAPQCNVRPGELSALRLPYLPAGHTSALPRTPAKTHGSNVEPQERFCEDKN